MSADEPVIDDELLTLLADASTWVEPGTDLEDSVVVAVAGEARSTVTARPASPRARTRWFGPLAGAVAGAAAAAVIAVVLVSGDDADDAPVANAPDSSIELVGTRLAPSIRGTAAFTTGASGVRIEIRATGLPRRDGDDFYQVWLGSCDGSGLVPAGSFHELDRATAWAGVSADEYPVLTITEESVAGPTDPGQGSSGRVVVTADGCE